MLQLRDVHTYYGRSHILQGVSLEVPEDTVAALLGRNGMGKTTTIHSIIGFNKPARGEIIYRGTNITGLAAHQIARQGIAIVPQGRRIFRSLTVKENLMLGWRRGSGKEKVYTPDLIYDMFPVLKARSKSRGEHLSGGEQQMLSIARALLTNPDLLLMDEPYEGLAPVIIKDLSRKIGQFKNSGLSILLVEQNIRVALEVADYVYIINKGKIVYEGTAKQVRAEEDLKKRFIAI